ncbi:MAG: nitroreductase family protein [Pseudomonadota bacterium]
MTDTHRAALQDLLRWRRDVRHFLPDPIEPTILRRLQQAMDLAPSIGNAQPWRILQVTTPKLRAAVTRNFEAANTAARNFGVVT